MPANTSPPHLILTTILNINTVLFFPFSRGGAWGVKGLHLAQDSQLLAEPGLKTGPSACGVCTVTWAVISEVMLFH